MNQMNLPQIRLGRILRHTRTVFNGDSIVGITRDTVTFYQIDRGDCVLGELMLAVAMYGDDGAGLVHQKILTFIAARSMG